MRGAVACPRIVLEAARASCAGAGATPGGSGAGLSPGRSGLVCGSLARGSSKCAGGSFAGAPGLLVRLGWRSFAWRPWRREGPRFRGPRSSLLFGRLATSPSPRPRPRPRSNACPRMWSGSRGPRSRSRGLLGARGGTGKQSPRGPSKNARMHRRNPSPR